MVPSVLISWVSEGMPTLFKVCDACIVLILLFLFVVHFHCINSLIFNGKKKEEGNRLKTEEENRERKKNRKKKKIKKREGGERERERERQSN